MKKLQVSTVRHGSVTRHSARPNGLFFERSINARLGKLDFASFTVESRFLSKSGLKNLDIELGWTNK